MSISNEIKEVVTIFDIDTDVYKTVINSKNVPISTISDIIDALNLHVSVFESELKRIKPNKAIQKKIQNLVQTLTKSGSQKFDVAIMKINKIMIKNFDDHDKMDDLQIDNPDEFEIQQRKFISEMYEWGKYNETDERYFFHMVFRWNLRKYHKLMVKRNVVMENPSYMFILDNICPSPSGCKDLFPPEFALFMSKVESFDWKVRFPVPIKGSGFDVTYNNKFGDDPEIVNFGKVMFSRFSQWVNYNTKYGRCIYPNYLLKGNENSEEVYNVFSRMRRYNASSSTFENIKHIGNLVFEDIIKKNCNIVNLFDEYYSLSLISVEEGLGFLDSKRSEFYCIQGKERYFFDVFDYKVSLKFKSFCNSENQVNYSEYTEIDKANMKTFLEKIINIFYVYNNKDSILFTKENFKEFFDNLS